MKKSSIIFAIGALMSLCLATGCWHRSSNYKVKHYTCDFEGEYWDQFVDSDTNGNNLTNNTLPTEWYDQTSNISGKVTEPYEGYWSGLALSHHCSKDLENDGQPDDQLYAYVEKAYSGNNFLICNCFFGGVELCFEEDAAFIESVMVANTTYSNAVTSQGNHMTPPLGENESIWIEAKGYTNGSDDVQSTATFYLYKNGKPAFKEEWAEWNFYSSMAKVDKIVFDIQWSGEGYNNFPAYFALDDIKIVRHEWQ